MLVSDRIRIDFLETFSNRSANGLKLWTDAPFRSSLLQKTKADHVPINEFKIAKWFLLNTEVCCFIRIQRNRLNRVEMPLFMLNSLTFNRFRYCWTVLLHKTVSELICFISELLESSTHFVIRILFWRKMGKMTIFFDKNIFGFGDLPSLAGR